MVMCDNKRRLGIIFCAFVSVCALFVSAGCNEENFHKLTVTQRSSGSSQITGLINATEIDVASKVPGRIEKLYVQEGQQVHVGDVLAELNLAELDAKLEQATSAISAAKAQLTLAKKGVRPQEKSAAANQVEMAKTQVDVMKKMLDRTQKLLDEKAIPQAKFDEVYAKYMVATNQQEMAQAKLDALNKGARAEEIQALEALVSKGESVATEIKIYQKERVQTAPVDGVVSKIVIHEGELCNTGYPIITIVKMDDMWASFAIREDRLKNIREGDVVEIDVPALDKKIPMVVYNISAMADFATWRATSDRDRFDLKSFEVKLRPQSPVEGLRPGMTARW